MKCESCGHENVEGARFCAKCGAAVPVTVIGQTDPLIGQVIGGRFHVTGVLGEGGMGIVYAGEQQMGTTVRKVAVKTLHTHLSKDASVMARFHREVGTVAQLEHPNTIKVYDFGSTKDGTLYIAMEFVAGRSLADVILQEGSLAPDRVVHIMRQVCGALDEAHGQGIVHRDLKPENIILTQRAGETDFVKVLDFGIAARTESADAQKEAKLTQQGMVLGTPPYMSPEQFTGKQLDARSDVYSLGVMAFEMLTGQLPFDAETPWEWATQHMTAAPKAFEVVAPTKNIPEGLRQAILRSLSKERTQRQDSARQFFDELSGGARMTIEASALGTSPGVAGMGYQPTAAMPAVPGQGGPAAPGGYAPTAMQPQVASTGPRVHTPVNTPGAVAAVPIPPPKKSSGSGKGLLMGLGGLGLVLAVTIVIVIVRSNQPDDVGPLTAPTGGTGALGPAVVTAETPTPDAPVAVNTPDPGKPTPVAGKPGGSKPGSGATAGKGGAPSTAGGTQPASTQPASTQPASTQPASGSGSNASCGQCVSQAAAGNIPGALTAYRSCSDAAEKAKCSSAARAPAMRAARSAAQGGQCDQAKAIVAAAQQMGAGAPISPLRGTSCDK
jgi:serine/threonine-protein kinase